MPLPKKKTSKARRDQRRSHHALTITGVSTCGNCGQPKLSHRVCPNCGHYNGRKILETK